MVFKREGRGLVEVLISWEELLNQFRRPLSFAMSFKKCLA